MKTFTKLAQEISEGKKVTIYQLRVMMGFVDRKPDTYLPAALELLRDNEPKLSNFDTVKIKDVLRSCLVGRESYLKKNVLKEHVDQFVLLNTIFVKGVQTNNIGEFKVHVPIYQITYGDKELGFSFYMSANKPVII